MGKRIIIAAYSFYPENGPRAFRTYELARELARQGHSVLLLIPNKPIYQSNPVRIDNLEIQLIGPPKQLSATVQKLTTKSQLMKRLKRCFEYWFPLYWCRLYIRELHRFLLQVRTPVDTIISISYPVASHAAICWATKKNKLLKEATKIAEYSDPFSNNRTTRVAFIYRWMDKWFGRNFDFFFIPVKEAVNTYTPFISKEKIRVVPQAFRLDELKLRPYEKHSIPTFAYAGVFYRTTRDPSAFFEYLLSLATAFKFVVYCPSPTAEETMNILNRYKTRMGNRLEIIFNLNRSELIKQLSTFDFLVNFNNRVQEQVPSKLIDYAIAKRPAVSISCASFNPQIFNEFLKGDYTNAVRLDLSQYDIREVTKQFLIEAKS